MARIGGMGQIEAHERRLVLEQLASSEARLLELVEGLTPEQWGFRESLERWSIAENIEHCIVFERFIVGMIAKALEGAAEPEKKTAPAAKDAEKKEKVTAADDDGEDEPAN